MPELPAPASKCRLLPCAFKSTWWSQSTDHKIDLSITPRLLEDLSWSSFKQGSPIQVRWSMCLEYSTSQRCSMGEGGRKRIALSRFLFVFYGHFCSLEIGVDIGFKYKWACVWIQHFPSTFASGSGSRALFMGPTNLIFNKIFIKNGSHNNIHTFKNYFAIVFSVFSFQQ